MLPEVVGAGPSRARPRAVFPEPDSPTTPSTSPRARVRVTPSTAFTRRPLRPSRRARTPPWSWKWTASWSSSSTVADRSSVTVSLGFVGNSDLLPGQRRALGLLQLETLGQVGVPARSAVSVTVVTVEGCANGAHRHGVRAAGMEMAAAGRLDQVGRRHLDGVEPGGRQRDGGAQQLARVGVLRVRE